MAENYFKIRNTYLGIDGSRDETDLNIHMQYSKGDRSHQQDILDNLDNMLQSSKNSGNSYSKTSEILQHKFYEVKDNQFDNTIDHESGSHKRGKDSIYSIFENTQNDARKLSSRFPLKSSMRDASNERCSSQQQKTVSFKETQSRNETGSLASNNPCVKSQGATKNNRLSSENDMMMSNQKNSRTSLSPFDRSIANYQVISAQLEEDMKKINARKEELERTKKERELRNSQMKSFMNSQSLTNSQIKNFGAGYSPNVLEILQNTTEVIRHTPLGESNLGTRLKKGRYFIMS